VQTNFTDEQRHDPDIQLADDILRACVHCGFCLATCPTYTLWGNELDSPRGRIYQIKDMLETGAGASPEITTHMDRCLSCFACVTTCPSGVDYQHLSDLARERIEADQRRGLAGRLLREFFAVMLTSPGRLRTALALAGLARPFGHLLPRPLRAALTLARERVRDGASARPGVYKAQGERKMRVALLAGCVQQVLGDAAHAATIRFLTRHGVEVVVAKGAGCCGALDQHMGRAKEAARHARRNIAAWQALAAEEKLDAIIVNASGCGTVVKDYAYLMRHDERHLAGAGAVAALAKDVTEVAAMLVPKPVIETGQVVAYHSACSMQHGQRLTTGPMELLSSLGFTMRAVPEGHLCCGSAGTYNLLQPEAAEALKARKLANINGLAPDVIATGNIGCQMQLKDGAAAPIVHTVELLDWATGGPKPF
jgi:glycolate oxidase iron-sulfur subunit